MNIQQPNTLFLKTPSIKLRLYEECSKIVDGRVLELKKILTEVQESVNNETKNSAGDKHETGRAMAQLETERITIQITEALKLQQVLEQINPSQNYEQVVVGSLVSTNHGKFYIAISLGKLEIEGETIFSISSASPIGQALMNKKVGDNLTFHGKNYIVNDIS